MSDMPYLFGGVASDDSPTRTMTWLFLLSFVCLGLVSAFTYHYFTVIRVQKLRGENAGTQLAEFVRKSEDLRSQAVMVNLGSFVLEMKKVPNARQAPGVVNMGELEIVAECKNMATRDYLSDNFVQVKNVLTNIFTPLDREEVLSREGKKALKRDITRRINSWLPEGMAVQDVYFPRLILN